MKTTDKQAAANRRNATRSTGPATPAGKAIASRNALKHGLLAKEIVIDAGEGAESQEEFNALVLDLRNQFNPQGPLEEMLVEKIAVAYWRLRRVYRYEAGVIKRNLSTTFDRYYERDPFKPDETKSRDDEIDIKVSTAQELHRAWQDDKSRFTKMHKAGKDLEEIYDREDSWNAFYEDRLQDIEDLQDGSPAGIRQAARETGWTDDAIWQAHIDLCTEQMEVYARRIEEFQKQKQKWKQENDVALQIEKEIGCIPEGYDLDRLLKYEGAIERQFYKAIDQLERLQRLRAGDQVPAPLKIDVNVDPPRGG